MRRIGDKVKCRHSMSNQYLSMDKEYTIKFIIPIIDGFFYELCNDKGYVALFRSDKFISIEEHRNGVISEILE